MLTGFLRNVIPLALPRPRGYCERILTAPPGAVTDANIGLLGSEDPKVYVHLTPEGARWPDRSHRFLRAAFLVEDLPGNQPLPWTVKVLSAVPAFAWQPSDWIQAHGFLQFSADGIGHQSETWLPSTNNPTCIALIQRVRFGDRGKWWAEVEYDAVHRLDAVPFRLRFGFSDPRIMDMSATLATGVQADINAATIPALLSGPRGASLTPHVGRHGYTLNLLGRGTIVNGQCIALRGSMLMLPPALIALIPPSDPVTPETASIALGQLMARHAISQEDVDRILGNWSETVTQVRASQTGIQDGWAPSPLPYLPAAPPWIAAADIPREADAWGHGNMASISGNVPFQRPRLGHLVNPEGTGAQVDFGLEHWEQAIMGGSVVADEAICRSVEYEAGRPSHLMEASGDPVTLAGHPQCRFWMGHPHWSPSESPDRLGKGTQSVPVAAGSLEQRGWEHFTANYVFAAWLAGDRLGREELLHLERIWTLSAKGVVPQSFLNSAGAARHTARFIWAGLQFYMATGNEQTLALCLHRANAARPQTGTVGAIIALRDAGQAASSLPTEKSWICYEDANAAVTLWALADFIEATKPADAARFRELVYQVCRTVVAYSYRMTDFVPMTCVAWLNGEPLTPAQMDDPNYRKPFPRSDYQWWILPAVLLGRKLALARGNFAMAQQASLIVGRVLQQRRRPANGPAWDSFGTWQPSVPQAEQVP